jgi:uncharacterized protein YydD (DUF2326 family)
MSEWRDKTEDFKTAVVANDWTPAQIRSASNGQIKLLLSLNDDVFNRVKVYFDKVRHLVSGFKEEKDSEEMFVGILAKLTTPQKNWLKRQDAVWLSEKINPPAKGIS